MPAPKRPAIARAWTCSWTCRSAETPNVKDQILSDANEQATGHAQAAHVSAPIRQTLPMRAEVRWPSRPRSVRLVTLWNGGRRSLLAVPATITMAALITANNTRRPWLQEQTESDRMLNAQRQTTCEPPRFAFIQ